MSAVGAELLKLRRSWSTWILVGMVVVVQFVFGYVVVYLVAQIPPPPDQPDGGFGQLLLDELRTDRFVGNVLGMLAGLGSAIALVLAAMHSAREYGWRTITTLFTQRPGRLEVFGAKLASLAVVVVIMVLAAFASGAAGAGTVAALRGQPLDYPPIGEIGSGIAAACLIVGAWAAVGHALGFLLRSTGLAIGLGLVYVLIIESVIQGFAFANATVEAVSRGLLGVNGSALAASFGPADAVDRFGVTQVEPWIAACVLAAYLIGASVAAAAVIAWRDVT